MLLKIIELSISENADIIILLCEMHINQSNSILFCCICYGRENEDIQNGKTKFPRR